MWKLCLSVFLVTTGVLAVAPPACGADVSATDFLNRMLMSKTKVQYSKQETVTRRECHQVCARGGMAGECWDRCEDKDYIQSRNFIDFAHVQSSEVTEVRDLVMEKEKIVLLPEKAHVARQSYLNCGPTSLNIALGLSVQGTKAFSVQKTEAVTATRGASITLGGNFIYGQASTSLNVSESVTLSTSITESHSESITRTINYTISISPQPDGVVGAFEYLAYETAIDIPFRATVVVDGSLEPNGSGYSRASDLLTAAERTLAFAGTLHVQNVSEGLVRNVSAPGKADCEKAKGSTTTTTERFDVPAQDMTDDYRNSFHLATAPRMQILSVAPDKKLLRVLSDGPTIGPADGVVYEVIAVARISRPTPACGFNDLSIANSGSYSVETRRYHQYSDGRQVAEWTDTVEVFEGCTG